ncbi:MAG: Si-specific NAD(P)(+) transhydrogenase [Gemmatimonadaceae bacterium]|jgi:NAD(P) transhydrogenase|nr:Si-specific NAD(P)(+) transhydrogenase [Gemmatimonadaceae bacterium]
MTVEQFDLVVIGAGPAGEKGAAQAAYFGKRVCLVERAPRPGGAAVNSGTIPSKTLRETALALTGLRHRGLYAVDWSIRPSVTLADLMHRERTVVEAEWQRIHRNLERHDVYTIQGNAHFVAPDALVVHRHGLEPRRLEAQAFLVASGARPARPAVLPFDDRIVVDSDSILQVEAIPRRLLVVGGGAVGCEYASIFAALGTQVTIVNARDRLLESLDAEASDALRVALTERLGITILSGVDVSACRIENGIACVTLSSGVELWAECVLGAQGRVGNTDDLGCEAAGLERTSRGMLVVDERYRTANPRVYAAGDVIGAPSLASTAMEQARVAMCHAFDLRYKQRLAPVLPYAVWTIPEVAMVGETEETLRLKGIAYEVARTPFSANARALIAGDTGGFVKLLFRPEDQKLLGASIVGDGASELIHVAMTVMLLGGTLDFFIQAVFNYPSLGEAFKYAAYDGLQRLQRRFGNMPGLRQTPITSASITDRNRVSE